MFTASNAAAGVTLAAPDVCLTPVGPVIVPIPYANVSVNALAVLFAETILITAAPALNVGSLLALSTGDQPGVAHWTIMGWVLFVLGSPKVMLEGTPAVSLLSPCIGNKGNAPLGLQALPSVTNVTYTLARSDAGATDPAAIQAEIQGALGGPAREVEARMLEGGTGYVALRVFSACAPSRVYGALRALEAQGMTALVLDLRDNHGGELSAAVELAGDFLEPGSEIATVIEADDDRVVHRAHGAPHRARLAILVNRRTASAAELFAGSLQAHGRALVLGETTHGKGIGQAFLHDVEGTGQRFAVVARFVLPGGGEVHEIGVRPDLEITAEGDEAIRAAVERLQI